MSIPVTHILHDYSRTNNTGPSQVVRQLTSCLNRRGVQSTILTVGAAAMEAPENIGLREFPLRPGGRLWRYPAGIAAYLSDLARRPGQVFHIHGVWGAPQWLAARAATRLGVPAILTIHGMLEPWHWMDGNLRRLKKLVYWYTVAYPAFRRLSVIQAITPLEREHLVQHFPHQRVEVIPNAVNLEEVDQVLSTPGLDAPLVTEAPYLLFLGRLHAKKGIDLLIAAFARTRPSRSFRLLIVGPTDNPGYTARLRTQIQALGLEDCVTFLGPVFGPQKLQLYRNAWAFCAPSHSEAIGLVNLEAAAAGTPVITTHETGLYDWEEGGGLLIHPRVEELCRALEQIFSWSESERQERGRTLRRLVERRYSLEAVGPQWQALYGELARGERG